MTQKAQDTEIGGVAMKETKFNKETFVGIKFWEKSSALLFEDVLKKDAGVS